MQAVLEGHTDWVEAVAVSPDGQLVVSAGGDRTVRVWELASGRQVRQLEGHTAPVRAVAVSPDGQLVVSAGGDKTVRVWELASGDELARWTGDYAITGAACRPADPLTVTVGDDIGVVYTLQLRGVGGGKALVSAPVLT